MADIFVGLDAATRKFGYGAVDGDGEIVDVGVISADGEFIERIDLISHALAHKLIELREDNNIVVVGIEEPHMRLNVKTLVQLSGIWAVSMLFLQRAGINFISLQASVWQNQTLAGIAGSNTKEKSINNVKMRWDWDYLASNYPSAILPRAQRIDDNAADALGIACYLYSNRREYENE